jgi:hypothetical protein
MTNEQLLADGDINLKRIQKPMIARHYMEVGRRLL